MSSVTLPYNQKKDIIRSYKLSHKNIVFLKIALKMGNTIAISPWYDLEEKKFLFPTINIIYSTLAASILLVVLSTSIETREYLDEQTVQKFLVTSSNTISVVLTEYSIVAAIFFKKDKWKKLIDNFMYIDDKLENNYNEQSKLIGYFYSKLFLVHMYFIGCYTYKALVYSNIMGIKYFSNYGTMVIPMYYIMFSVIILSNIVLAFRQRYYDLNALLERKINSDNTDIDIIDSVDVIGRYYKHLGDTVEVFNELFGWIIILLLLHSIIEILNCVNLLIKSCAKLAFKWEIISSCLWVCSISMGGAVYTILCCDSASSEGEKIIRLCYKLQERFDIVSDVRKELNTFAIMSKSYAPRFVAANFFTVDRSTILGILSIATTYLIVVIQFNQTLDKN